MKGLKFPKIKKYKLKFAIPKAPTYPQLVKKLDKAFSDFLKAKSKGKCSRCGQVRKNAGVSHYWSRVNKGTRWDEDNCDWLCWLPCHSIWEHEKQGAYRDYMMGKLQVRGYEKLQIKALAVAKWTTLDLQMLIKEYESNPAKD